MLKKIELYNNINTENQISKEFLNESRYGLCRYISDICNSIDLNNEIASIAMIYTNYFFVKKCYFNYEKLIIACASILLACKYENIQGRLTDICKACIVSNTKIFGHQSSVIKPEDVQKIKEKITLAEINLLKCLNFEINVNLPNEFVYVYSSILYPDNEVDVLRYSLRICYDSFFTYVNLLYKNYVVAICCIIIAAKFLCLPTIMDKNFKHLDNMKDFHLPPAMEEEFNRRLLCFENKSLNVENKNYVNESYYDILDWNKKIHPYLEIDDLTDCLKMIVDFYEETTMKYAETNKLK